MIGRLFGSYQVLAKLGEGGMGEVYRARDLKLGRDVALKALPASFATDQDRLARFRREAQVLASLNHPNIGHIYGFEDGGGSPALILELVEGPTLADRLERGAMSLHEALQIARQVTLALEAAHEQAIIHRDLKPSNIKVKDDGTVKVLDFGLAKALATDTSTAAADAANSPTLTNRATALGVILGTAAYMAPEQAKGKPVDKRADIWSFGVVLYEMLTGRRLFRGEDASDTLAEVLKIEIDWRALPASTPSSIVRLLRRCLERDPRQRLHDIADARVEIDDAIAVRTDAGPAPPVAAGAASSRERWLWAVALVGTAVAAAAITWSVKPAAPAPPETRLQIVTPPSRSPLSVGVSPDGRSVAFFGTVDGKTQIWVRPLDAVASHPVPGSDVTNGAALSWSIDGRSLNYADSGAMKTISTAGGTARATSVRVGFGMTWNADGTLLTATSNGAPILRMRQSGGPGEPVTELVPPVIGHRFPAFLPDGRHFLFLATGPASVQGTYMGALDSKEVHLVGLGDTAAVFLPPDHVVFGRQDALLAQRVNLRTGELDGEPVFVADGVFQNRTVFGSVSLASTSAGTLAYREAFVPRHQLRWVDRAGKEISRVADLDPSEFEGPPHVSPDGRTILIARRVNGNTDIWTVDNTEHGTQQRLTSDPAADLGPMWSADGTRIAFSSARRGGGFYSLYETTLSRAGAERALFETPDNVVTNDWSRDNRYILFQAQGRQQVARDLWALSPDGDGTPIQITNTPADETYGQISPDGHWVAYQSTASGTGIDVYVRPFQREGREWRISTAGGIVPKWRGDARELYYLDPDARLMAVSLTLPATGVGVLEHGQPAPLFRLVPGSLFEPAADGQRFLVNVVLDEARTPPITVILNWRRPAPKR